MEQLEEDFYHEDFTNETAWEELNAKFVELLLKWQLAKSELNLNKGIWDSSNCHWTIQEQTLNYLNEQITIKYYRADELNVAATSKYFEDISPVHLDLFNFCEKFALPEIDNGVSNLCNCFGLRRFIIVQAGKSADDENSSFVRLLLSSISMAIADIKSELVIFLQIGYPDNFSYVGMSLTNGTRTDFNVSSWIQGGSQYASLQFLSSLYREKAIFGYEHADITVSVRQTYSVSAGNNDLSSIRYKPWLEDDGLLANIVLPFGIDLDEHLNLPLGFKDISKGQMYTIFTWPAMNERLLFDFTTKSTNLTPSKALHTFFAMKIKAIGYLTDCLQIYESLNGQKNTVDFDNESFVWYLSPILTQHSEDPEFWDKEQDCKIAYLLEYWKKHNYAKEIQICCDDDLQQMEEYLFPEPENEKFSYKIITEEMVNNY